MEGPSPSRKFRFSLPQVIGNLPIRLKLKAIILSAIGAAMLVACIVFFFYDLFSMKAAAHQRLQTLAEVVAGQSTAAVAFGDVKTLKEILGALSAEEDIELAACYGKDHQLLAGFDRRPGEGVKIRPVSPPPGYSEGGDFFAVALEIKNGAEILGMVYLHSSLRTVSARLKLDAMILLAVLILATLVALVLASRLEGTLIGPILSLSSIARTVSKEKNYALRAVKVWEDELGLLTDGFNEMLGQIQERDLALGQTKDGLERRVTERTAELTLEVTERKRAEASLIEREEQYRNLVEQSPDAILIHIDGRIVFANSSAIHLLGCSDGNDLMGRNLFDFVHVESRESEREQARRLLEDRKGIPFHELRYVRLDGRFVDVEAAASLFRYGGLPSIQLAIRDVTKRKEVDRLKSEFISTVSHELRTPLTSISGALGLIAGGALGSLTPKLKSLVDLANNNAERLGRLINDLLDIEKIEAGKIEIKMQPLDLMKLVEHAIDANRSYADRYGVLFKVTEKVDGARVLADADRLEQVMANLLSNAAKFSPRGKTVDVSVARGEGGIKVSISDRGPGIPESFRSRIFQKFAQADSSDTRLKGGTGLGLSITKSLVERMGGQIAFETVADRGTTFVIQFPDLDRKAPPSTKAESGVPRILIVEDDKEVAQILKMMVQELGYATDLAYTSGQAKLLLSEGAYDAITVDIMLPDESGINLLQQVRKDPRTRNLPAIVVSAKAGQAKRELQGMALSIADWIEKPIDEKRLAEALHAAVKATSSGKCRILHVEDDPDIRHVVELSLKEIASVRPAATIAEARLALAAEAYDLVILDLVLPDGWGMELAPDLSRPGRPPTPIVVFSALESRKSLQEQVAAALIKSKVSPEEFLETIRSVLGLSPLRTPALGAPIGAIE